jgi:Icc protein
MNHKVGKMMLIAQMTDTHIVDKNEDLFFEPLTKTKERLSKVIAYLNEMNPLPDALLFTGDASDTGTQASYCHLKEIMEPLKIPFYVIPGNHDCRKEMRKAFLKYSYMPKEGFIHYVINEYPIRLIGLDTHVPGEAYGHICEERLFWLNQILGTDKEKPTLIFMHHPPAKTGCKVFDRIGCFTHPEFERLLSSQSHLLGMVTGHYHHLCVTSFANKLCFIAPSVGPIHYFANSQDEDVTALELEDPALTLHQWHGGNILTSHVIRLKEQHFRLDWSTIKKKSHSS